MNTNIMGLLGELQTCKTMDSYDTSLALKYIANFPVKDSNDKYYQIDTLVVCKKGIFCVEVKNWNAQIYCSQDYYWHLMYTSGEKVVRSPISQNQNHCNKVHALCNKQVNNIVLFTECGTLHSPSSEVMYIHEFLPHLLTLPDILSVEQIEDVYNGFMTYKQQTEIAMLVDFIFKSF